MYYKQTEGRTGEDMATEYLSKKGYIIICKNFRCFQGEIDIVARDKEYLVFIEVKTRTSIKYGEAREAVRRGQTKTYIQSSRILFVQK